MTDDAPAELLAGGATHAGAVVRIGDTVRRPRTAGAALVEAFLLHLEDVGFDGAPRFLGLDDEGRQVLTFVDGSVSSDPPWQLDDDANIAHLAAVARLLRRLYAAAAGFEAPPGATPQLPCPVPGTAWLHADAHYGNVVFRGDDPVALIDWEFVAPGDALYDPVGLLICTRQPRLDRPDELRARERNARRTLAALLDAYGADDDQRSRAAGVAARFFHGAADYLAALTDGIDHKVGIDNRRYLADWWGAEAETMEPS